MGDFENKGLLDPVVTQLDGCPVLLRNRPLAKPSARHWIAIRTIGKKSNRDGFGARNEVRAAADQIVVVEEG